MLNIRQLNLTEELTKNFPDIDVRRKLMKEYGKFQMPYFGVNEDGENVELHIAEDSIVVRTYQENGWIRVNYYDAEGYAEGETFEGLHQ